ncbi:MAG: nitroreductase family deazaflavin-dependent oxidoreductase [Candidatus Hodarchaeota archaeon]
MNQIKQLKLPRPGSALYNLNHENDKIRKKTLKKWRLANKLFVIPLYRLQILPCLGFGRIFLIIKTIGRKTGKKRRTPVEYHWINNTITVFSGRGEDAGWVKNIRANPGKVWIKYGFHKFHAYVKFINDEEQKLNIIKWYVSNHSRSAKLLFGWDPKKDEPEITDFSNMINILTILHLYPKNT